MVGNCNLGSSGGWGKRIAWTRELEVTLGNIKRLCLQENKNDIHWELLLPSLPVLLPGLPLSPGCQTDRAVLKLGLSLASSNVWPASTSHSKNCHWVFKYYSDCPWCSKPVNPTTQWMWDKAKAEASQVLGQPGLHNKFQATCGPQNREEQVSKVEDEPSIHEIVGSVSIIIRINKQQTLSQAFFNKDKAM